MRGGELLVSDDYTRNGGQRMVIKIKKKIIFNNNRLVNKEELERVAQ